MRVILILCILISCKTVNFPPPAARMVVYSNAQLTVMHIEDSIRISNLEKLVVLLPASQWTVNTDGTVSMTNQTMDTLIVKSLYVGGRPPKDTTTNPHDGNDTLQPEHKLAAWRINK